MRNSSIGVFDSGLGGLSILKEILKALPEYDYVYLGDNARVPYGGRSPELIYQFTKKAVDFLFRKQNCFLIIIACNTATAAALRRIQQEYLPKSFPKRRVLGVIRPIVEVIIENKARRVGVIGTYATVESKAFIKEFKKLAPKISVYQKACPLLVPIIEEGETEWKGLELILQRYLKPLKAKKIDNLVLGCTHYGLITSKIAEIMGKKVNITSPGRAVAVKLKDYLKRHPEIEKKLSRTPSRKYFVTDLNKRYIKLIKLFLGNQFCPKDKLELIQI